MSSIDKILKIIGKNIDSAQDIAHELKVELFPDTTRSINESAYGLLERWEATYEIVPEDPSDYASRRAVLTARVIAVGGFNEAYFLALAAVFGYQAGTHAEVGDPHIRITDGDFRPFTADQSIADFDSIWDQEPGAFSKTICVRGTDVEDDVYLIATLNKYKIKGTEFIFINE